jgi:carboxymethylenebutenolidase
MEPELSEREIDIPTPDGAMNTVVIRPKAGGRLPPVMMFMPASGIRPEIVGLARRLAAAGYLVLLPNLYYRLVRVLDCDANRLPDSDYEPVAVFTTRLFESVTDARATADIGAMLHWLAQSDDAAEGPAGVIGYCMGGRLALVAIGAFPEQIAAAASLYGSGLVTDAALSPHRAAARAPGELYLAFAEQDAHVALSDAARLEAAFTAAGTRHRIEIYPDAGHGFAFPERRTYQHAGAERSWQRVFDLFARTLVSTVR